MGLPINCIIIIKIKKMYKVYRILLAVLLCVYSSVIYSQNVESLTKIPLKISDVKWIYLKFASDVKYVDMGTDDIQMEKTAIKSILRIKSRIPSFDNTTTTIITNNGKIYTLQLEYETNPEYLAVNMSNVIDTIAISDVIHNYSIELSKIRTSHIVMGEKIADVMVGVDEIIAEQIDDMNNIVRARAVTDFNYFEETSLTIVTTDGNIYPFSVTHNDNPSNINITLSSQNPKAKFSKASLNDTELDELGKQIVQKGTRFNNIGAIEEKIVFCLKSICIKDDILMFYLFVENRSQVAYEVDFIRSYIKNKKKGKKQTSQDDEIVPIHIYKTDDKGVIDANGYYSTIFFFKRFTVPSNHLFFFELFEKNGGRHLKFTCSNNQILKAEIIGESKTELDIK
ncbi:MAG: DUF4138 domain-containing protein, partial [Bacteroidales bacterium]|nr:DUF4138 domain-containing protein [Candidatus Scybalocola fimicaballi]